MEGASIASSGIVRAVLTRSNYEEWKTVMKNYLIAENLWDVIEAGASAMTEAKVRKNAKALHIIQLTCASKIFDEIKHFETAVSAWNYLASRYISTLQVDPDIEQGSEDSVLRTGSEDNVIRTGSEDSVLRTGSEDSVLVYRSLSKYVEEGDLISLKSLLKQDMNALFSVSILGRTLLHTATIAGQLEIVDLLTWYGESKLAEMQDYKDYTALALAAQFTGEVNIAKCILERGGMKMLNLVNREGQTPLFLAATMGHKEMARLLYSLTSWDELHGSRDRVLLFDLCIKAELFDVASNILYYYPELPAESISYGFGALNKLAQMPSVFYSGSQLGLPEQIIYYLLRVEKNYKSASTALLTSEGRQHASFLGRWCSLVWHFLLFPVKLLGRLVVKIVHLFLQFFIILNIFGIREIYVQKQTHYQVLHILRYLTQIVADFNALQLRETSVYDAMLNAARHGIVEFIDAMKVANPDLLLARDNNGRNIFSYAVLHRKPNVFQLIHTLNLKKNIMIESSRDYFGNNLLHQAGHLGQFSDINHRPGAALQMQREIQWFKAVEEIVHPKFKEEINEDNKKPHELFTETHEELVKAGEQWAKEAAASFTIVGTLITTIMFAAAFTVPGGSNQDTGVPIFLNDNLFTTFVVADAISLFTSVTSVLIFIEVQTSRFSEIDFLTSLPLKILLGLFFLFVSVVSMMVVFCAALAIVLHKSKDSKHLFVGGVILGSVPVIVLIQSQLRLMYEIFRSTLSNPIR